MKENQKEQELLLKLDNAWNRLLDHIKYCRENRTPLTQEPLARTITDEISSINQEIDHLRSARKEKW